MMRASREVDLITGLEAQTHRSDMSFQSRSRINRPAYVVRA